MNKAFELKALEIKLKEKGFPVLEQGALASIDAIFEWLDESIDKSDTKYDDYLKPAAKVLKEFILGKVDRISTSTGDKKEDQKSTSSSWTKEEKPEATAKSAVASNGADKKPAEGTEENPTIRTSQA